MFVIRCKNAYQTSYLVNFVWPDRSRWTNAKRDARQYETREAATLDMLRAIQDLAGPARDLYSVVAI